MLSPTVQWLIDNCPPGCEAHGVHSCGPCSRDPQVEMLCIVAFDTYQEPPDAPGSPWVTITEPVFEQAKGWPGAPCICGATERLGACPDPFCVRNDPF